jgi:hypothetical protein
MDEKAQAELNPHLLAREHLLWCGRPHDTSSLVWRAAAIVVIAAGALAMRSLPIDSPLGQHAQVNSVVLALLVFTLIAEAFIFHSYLATTIYGLTNQRVIIVSGLRNREAIGVFLDRINRVQMTVRRHGSNIVLRGRPIHDTAAPAYLPFTDPSRPPQWFYGGERYLLFGLENASHVLTLILESAGSLA